MAREEVLLVMAQREVGERVAAVLVDDCSSAGRVVGAASMDDREKERPADTDNQADRKHRQHDREKVIDAVWQREVGNAHDAFADSCYRSCEPRPQAPTVEDLDRSDRYDERRPRRRPGSRPTANGAVIVD